MNSNRVPENKCSNGNAILVRVPPPSSLIVEDQHEREKRRKERALRMEKGQEKKVISGGFCTLSPFGLLL